MRGCRPAKDGHARVHAHPGKGGHETRQVRGGDDHVQVTRRALPHEEAARGTTDNHEPGTVSDQLNSKPRWTVAKIGHTPTIGNAAPPWHRTHGLDNAAKTTPRKPLIGPRDKTKPRPLIGTTERIAAMSDVPSAAMSDVPSAAVACVAGDSRQVRFGDA